MNDRSWTPSVALVAIALAAVWVSGTMARQAKQFSLETPSGLRLQNVSAVPATLQGQKGLRVNVSDETIGRLKSMTPEEQARQEFLAVVEGLEFGNGTIEAEIAGEPSKAAGEGA